MRYSEFYVNMRYSLRRRNTLYSHPIKPPTIYHQTNFGSLLKNAYQCYLDQNIYFTKRHHIMSNVPLNVNITKNRVVNSKGKMMKNHWEKLKTQSTTNRWKQTSVNIFLDFSANIFCYYKSSATPACKTWKLELMDITRKYTESRKKKYSTTWKKKLAQWGAPDLQKMFYTTLK